MPALTAWAWRPWHPTGKGRRRNDLPIKLRAVNLFAAVHGDPRFEELLRLLATERGVAAAEGLWGSAAPVLAALAAQRLGRPLLLITAHADEADDCRDDIETAVGRAPDLLPQLEQIAGESTEADELAAERLRLCMEVMRWESGRVITAPEREAARPESGASPQKVVPEEAPGASPYHLSPNPLSRYSGPLRHRRPIMALSRPCRRRRPSRPLRRARRADARAGGAGALAERAWLQPLRRGGRSGRLCPAWRHCGRLFERAHRSRPHRVFRRPD